MSRRTIFFLGAFSCALVTILLGMSKHEEYQARSLAIALQDGAFSGPGIVSGVAGDEGILMHARSSAFYEVTINNIGQCDIKFTHNASQYVVSVGQSTSFSINMDGHDLQWQALEGSGGGFFGDDGGGVFGDDNGDGGGFFGGPGNKDDSLICRFAWVVRK